MKLEITCTLEQSKTANRETKSFKFRLAIQTGGTNNYNYLWWVETNFQGLEYNLGLIFMF